MIDLLKPIKPQPLKSCRRKLRNQTTSKTDKIASTLTLTAISNKHRSRPTRSTPNSLTKAKENSDKVYNETLNKLDKNKVKETENLHHAHQHGAAWQALREVTNKQSFPVINVKAFPLIAWKGNRYLSQYNRPFLQQTNLKYSTYKQRTLHF